MIDIHHISSTIGTRVRAERTLKGIPRRRLAATADVSERYLNQLENGDANVSVGILARVARALDVDLVSLLPPSSMVPTSGASGASLHAPLLDLAARMSLREQEGAVAVIERYLGEQRRLLKGIALLGLRGAGKSTLGRLFAGRHGLPFLSVTREVEVHAGMSLPDLFNLGGPDAYRSLEMEVVKDLAARSDRIVVETAGGIVSNGPALEVILASFRTVWLKASPEEHLDRVIRQGDTRPMQATPKALEHLMTLLASREQEYMRADCALDTTGRGPEACVDELERLVEMAA